MELGFGLPVAGSWATAEAMVGLARQAEAAGYASLWSFQRLLYPVQAELPAVYRSVHDPVVSLAYVAAATERIRLGTAVVNVPFYAPIVLAKQLASLDLLSGGRLDVGLGLGWSAEEFAAVGVAFQRRGARAEEFVAALRAIWGENPVSFQGELFQVPPSLVDPKPAQRPGPPLLFGGAAPASLRRAGRIADGWISASRQDLSRLGDCVALVRQAAEEAGRDPDRLRIVVRGVVALGSALRAQDGSRQALTGSAEQIRADLGMLAEAGATEVFLDCNFDARVGSVEVEPDRARDLAEQTLQAFAPG